jgi:hypothetical protein
VFFLPRFLTISIFVITIISLFAALAMRDYIALNQVMVIALATVSCATLGWLALHIHRSNRRRRIFRELIGMRFSDRWDPEQKSLVQPLVDLALQCLARDAKDAFERENKKRAIRLTLPVPGTNPTVQEVEVCLESRCVTDSQIAELHKQSELSKARFWAAHKAFSELGFVVREKIGYYE